MRRVVVPVAGFVIGTVSFGAVFLIYYHRRLMRIVTKKYSMMGRLTREKPRNFPEKYAAAGNSAAASVVFNDVFEKVVPAASLPRNLSRAELLTAYVRKGLSGFASLPQGRLFRFKNRGLAAPGVAMTPEEIRRLPFQVGDRLIGMYSVTRREDGSGNSASVIELAFQQDESVAGVMVFRILPNGSNTVFTSETIMWSPSDPTASKIPLANPVVCYLHEVTAMHLLHSSVTGLLRDAVESNKQS